jgi:hypothetical protein
MIVDSFSIGKNIIPCSYRASSVPPNFLTPTKCHLYLANSLAAVVREPALYRLLTFQVPSFEPRYHYFVSKDQSRSEAQVYVL